MKTVPLYGKKAAGRVTLVDDEDYGLVMQFRWRVAEHDATATRRPLGPYAVTGTRKPDGRRGTMTLHNLITGWPLVDHINHNGLDNRRHNLRPASTAQNGQNSRGKITARSQYKGITWDFRDRLWKARIETLEKARTVCASPSELEAAYAYDAAARETFGEFACTNFPDGPTQAMRDEWQAEREARSAALDAAVRAARSKSRTDWWAQREHETHTCEACGDEFQTRATVVRYCSRCSTAARRQRRKQRRQEGALS